LERKALPAELGNDRNLDHLSGVIDPAVAFVTGRYDFALIPPLELPQADLRNVGDLHGRIRPFFNLGFVGLQGETRKVRSRGLRALNITGVFRFGRNRAA